MNIAIFLVVFILIIFELLFSLLHIVPEVINNSNEWDRPQSGTNETLCDAAVYISNIVLHRDYQLHYSVPSASCVGSLPGTHLFQVGH